MPFFVNTKSHSSVANEGFQVVLLFVFREVAFDSVSVWYSILKTVINIRLQKLPAQNGLCTSWLIDLSRCGCFVFFPSLRMDFDGIVVWTSGL